VFKGNFLSVIKLIIVFGAIFGGSFKQSKNSEKKGFVEVVKTGTIFPAIFLLLNIILFRQFGSKNIVYYILIIAVSVAGSLFGVSKRKKVVT
jgi:putative membrane protein (TIGR04086 family)